MKFIKKEWKNIKGGRCVRSRDGRLGFIEKKYGKITWRRTPIERMIGIT